MPTRVLWIFFRTGKDCIHSNFEKYGSDQGVSNDVINGSIEFIRFLKRTGTIRKKWIAVGIPNLVEIKFFVFVVYKFFLVPSS